MTSALFANVNIFLILRWFLISENRYTLEKARVIDPFGHAGFDPSGKIRLTL